MGGGGRGWGGLEGRGEEGVITHGAGLKPGQAVGGRRIDALARRVYHTQIQYNGLGVMKTNIKNIFVFMMVVLALATGGWAAPPNDNFESPTVLAGFPAVATGSNEGATLEDGEPVPNSWADSSVWFQWTAPTSGAVQIDTMGSEYATVLAVWTNSELSQLGLVVQSDPYDDSGRGAGFFDVVSGATYRIAVYGSGGDLGAIALRITNDVLGRIAGRVTGPEGTPPLEGHTVIAVREEADGMWQMMGSDLTDGMGNYEIRGLPADSYWVWFGGGTNGDYVTEIYENAASYESGTAIVVAGGETVTGINAELAVAGKIAGTVTGPDGETPLEGIEVMVSGWNAAGSYWTTVSSGRSDATGRYVVGRLPGGTYRVTFSDGQNGNYLPEVYDNAGNMESGTDVVVAAGETVTGVDASLAAAGKIAGTVTGSDGETPLEGVVVSAYGWEDAGEYWQPKFSGYTGSDGNYVVGGLTSGTYRVAYQDGNGNYIAEAYSNASRVDVGMDVVVAEGETVAGVDASLAAAGKIAGTVTGPDGETPLEGIEISVYVWEEWNEGEEWMGCWTSIGSERSNTGGGYVIGGLLGGTYRVEFRDAQNGNYVTEVYDDAADVGFGTDVVVAAGETVAGVDASLAAAGKITGTVTGPDGETPLEGIDVSAYCWNDAGEYWQPVFSAFTDENGNYIIRGLLAGTYRVEFIDVHDTYAPETYSNVVAVELGQDIVVAEGETAEGIDASLALAGKITGTVTGPDGETPLADIHVIAWMESGNRGSGRTDADGAYLIDGLMAGQYWVQFQDESGGYLSEYFSNAVNQVSSSVVEVGAGETVMGINAELAAAGKIAGTVTRSDGSTPVEGIYVDAYSWSGGEWVFGQSDTTDAWGRYMIGGLSGGTYRVRFSAGADGYLYEVYDDAANIDLGRDIEVAEGETVTGIDALLVEEAMIAGMVTGPDGDTPLAGIEADAYRWTGSSWIIAGSILTDDNGCYSLEGLPPGTYRVAFRDWQNGNYLSEVYNNAADLESGTDVVVAEGATVEGIDAWLAMPAAITGRVVGPDGVMPLENLHIVAYRWTGADWIFVTETYSGSEGQYEMGGLAAGRYRVVFQDFYGNYVSEIYPNHPGEGPENGGTDIWVGESETVSGIDARLAAVDSADLAGIRAGAGGEYEVLFTGTEGLSYILQEAASLTSEWVDVGSGAEALPGTNVLPRPASAAKTFWRVRRGP